MKVNSLLTAILLCLFLLTEVQSQEVLVSQEISIRRDFNYDIIGKVNNRILVFRDLGFDFEINSFDENLTYEWKRELSFEKKKVKILGILPTNSDFTIYYIYRHKNDEYVMARKYDDQGDMIDSTMISVSNRSYVSRRHGFTNSDNKNKVLLFYTDRDKLIHTYVINNDSLDLSYESEIRFEGTVIEKDFRGAVVANNGEAYLIMEKNNSRFKKKKHKMQIFELSPFDEAIYKTDIDFKELLSIDVEVSFDNINNKIIIAGLYSDNSNYKAQGYYFWAFNKKRISSDKEIQFVPFKEALLKDANGKNYETNKTLEDFRVKDIIHRRDGGIVLISEMKKELSRRNAYPSPSVRADYYSNTSGWIDHYNEDVVALSIHPDGQLHWHAVLYKKQFSQDEEIAFSSYFLFKNPSMIRLIYNDEIKKDNTVSEYVLDPIGRQKRRSLLSTEYQSLKLRFRDAVQIASNEFVVPSERGNRMSLVKVSY